MRSDPPPDKRKLITAMEFMEQERDIKLGKGKKKK